MAGPVTSRLGGRAVDRTARRALGTTAAGRLAPILGPVIARAVLKRLARRRRGRKLAQLDRQATRRRARADARPSRRRRRTAARAERRLARASRRATPRRLRP